MDPRGTFHAELQEITREIVLLAAHVTEAIPAATEAFLASDLDAAQQVIDHDDVLDALAADIAERCYRTLARQQPVASDLRSLVAAMQMVGEIERSGDLVVNVCKVRCGMRAVELSPAIRGLLERMADEAGGLFRACIDAYADGDAALAADLDRRDDHLDRLQAEFLDAVVRWGEDGSVRQAVQLAMIGRYYERIGDHAVNIGERVRFLIEGARPAVVPPVEAG